MFELLFNAQMLAWVDHLLINGILAFAAISAMIGYLK